jgi:ribosomal protein S18 acetylase RimI-like enzyme
VIDPAISIRLMRPDDAAAFRAIRLEALERNPESFGASLEVEATQPIGWFAERLQRNAVFGAFADADLLGIAGFHVEAGAKFCHKGVLWGVYVHPSGRGAGVARKLIERVIEHAREHVELLHLTVVSTNERAQRLYAHLGFTGYGIEKHGLKHGGAYFDEVHMVKFL